MSDGRESSFLWASALLAHEFAIVELHDTIAQMIVAVVVTDDDEAQCAARSAGSDGGRAHSMQAFTCGARTRTG